MAPEMLSGDLARVDARTDVYLLGATLHAVLTGACRHGGRSLLDVLRSASASAPFAYGPEVPAELGAICNRATSADPDARFPTALALRHALAAFRRHRGSLALSDRAAAKLGEIGTTPGEAGRAVAALTECRFGFLEALREWKDNTAARAGLQRCLEAMIDHELARQDAAGARQLLAELPEPRPELGAKIAALEVELQAAEARQARLRALERDQDLSVSARPQLVIVGLMALVALGVGLFLRWHDGRLPTTRALIVVPAVNLAILLAAVAAFWRRLHTAISRRLVVVLLLIPALILAHRISAAALGAPLPAVIVADLCLGMSVASVAAIAMVPRGGWTAVPFALGVVAATLRPALAGPVFLVSLLAAILVLVLVMTLARPKRT